jgi:hypothetical protein
MTKVCAIWYARSVNIGAKNEVVEVIDDTQIKNVFGELLFDKNANCLLVNYKNTLYVIEATDRDKSLYSRRTIDYHPLSDLVKI